MKGVYFLVGERNRGGAFPANVFVFPPGGGAFQY